MNTQQMNTQRLLRLLILSALLPQTVLAQDVLPEAMRDALQSELRKENGATSFSHYLYAFHREVKQLQHEAPTLILESQAMMLLMAYVGKLEYLADKLDADAPFYLSTTVEFDKLISRAQASVTVLRKAVLTGQAMRVLEAIQKLQDPYDEIFIPSSQ